MTWLLIIGGNWLMNHFSRAIGAVRETPFSIVIYQKHSVQRYKFARRNAEPRWPLADKDSMGESAGLC